MVGAKVVEEGKNVGGKRETKGWSEGRKQATESDEKTGTESEGTGRKTRHIQRFLKEARGGRMARTEGDGIQLERMRDGNEDRDK